MGLERQTNPRSTLHLDFQLVEQYSVLKCILNSEMKIQYVLYPYLDHSFRFILYDPNPVLHTDRPVPHDRPVLHDRPALLVHHALRVPRPQ